MSLSKNPAYSILVMMISYTRWVWIFCTINLLVILATSSAHAQQASAASVPLDSMALHQARQSLEARMKSAKQGERIRVIILTDNAEALAMKIKGELVMEEYDIHTLPGLITTSLSANQIVTVMSWQSVDLISLANTAQPETKNEGYDFTLPGINYLHHHWPGLRGHGLTVSIKEHAFNDKDIDLAGRIRYSSIFPADESQHATRIASLAAGAPNSDPYSLGVAPDAQLTASDFSMLTPDQDSLFEQLTVTVQNHSYGSPAIENYYGPEAMAYDASAQRLPGVMHVFSAGNKGNESPPPGSPYAGLIGWSTISGTYKQSKNTIAVGAVDSFRNVFPFSSTGPAYDGRIKPELMMHSRDGTSGAAAIVSGVSLLVQQSYVQAHGFFPPAALLRAALINTAEDIENPGPDFRTGYGLVRAHHAVKLIEDNRFAIDTAIGEAPWESTIAISDGMFDLRVTLAWSDPAAEVFAVRALVNDLDLELIRMSDGQVFYPFVLNHAMHRDSLQQPAHTGIDTINNNEHISIKSPAAGEYRIRVKGKSVEGNQLFAVAWSANAANQFYWIYPTASDVPEAGRRTGVRWATDIDRDGVIEYKWVDSSHWQMLAAVHSKNQYSPWTWPAESGLMQIRFSAGDDRFISDTFTVSSQLQMKVAYVCEDTSLVYWPSTPGAEAYRVSLLGNSHLIPVTTVADTFYPIDADFSNEYLAVAPVFDDRVGRNSQAIRFRSQGVGCFINHFFLHHLEDSIAIFQADISWLEGIRALQLERVVHGQYFMEDTADPVSTFITQLRSALLQQGRNVYRLVVQFEDGRSIVSEEVSVYYTGRQDLILFPNPPGDNHEITIYVRRQDVFDIVVYDMMGREVINFPETSNPIRIPTFTLPAGVYIVAAWFEDGQVVSAKLLNGNSP